MASLNPKSPKNILARSTSRTTIVQWSKCFTMLLHPCRTIATHHFRPTRKNNGSGGRDRTGDLRIMMPRFFGLDHLLIKDTAVKPTSVDQRLKRDLSNPPLPSH